MNARQQVQLDFDFLVFLARMYFFGKPCALCLILYSCGLVGELRSSKESNAILQREPVLELVGILPQPHWPSSSAWKLLFRVATRRGLRCGEWVATRQYSTFVCDTEHEYYKKVTWVYINSWFNFLPKFFTVPSFRPILDALFLDRMEHSPESCETWWVRQTQLRYEWRISIGGTWSTPTAAWTCNCGMTVEPPTTIPCMTP
jgi:hypothetical protein